MARLFLVYYNLSCVPSVMLDVAGNVEFILPETLKFDLLTLLNNSTTREGYANVLTDFEKLHCTKHEDIVDGKLATVLQIAESWMELSPNLVLALPQQEIAVGSQVQINNPGNGYPTIELVCTPEPAVSSLDQLRKIHNDYFPLPPNPPVGIEEYPETVGNQRLQIEHLKKLKPFKKSFHRQVEELKKNYSSWRKSRGDGNCYYRAVAFSYLEHLCRAGVSLRGLRELHLQLYLQVGNFSLKSRDQIFDRYFICALIRLKELVEIKTMLQSAVEHLEYIFVQDKDFDTSMIMILKLACANYLEAHESTYRSFLTMPLSQVVSQILADGVESEGVVFKVMVNVLDCVIAHVMLHDNEDKVLTEEFSPERLGRKPVLTLLLRPGHYDILYPYQADAIDCYDFSKSCYNRAFALSIGSLFQLYRTTQN